MEFSDNTTLPRNTEAGMKLMNLNKGDKFRILETHIVVPPVHRDLDGYEVLTFDHIDGMYSLCYDKDGRYVHPAAWTEVEVME